MDVVTFTFVTVQQLSFEALNDCELVAYSTTQPAFLSNSLDASMLFSNWAAGQHDGVSREFFLWMSVPVVNPAGQFGWMNGLKFPIPRGQIITVNIGTTPALVQLFFEPSSAEITAVDV